MNSPCFVGRPAGCCSWLLTAALTLFTSAAIHEKKLRALISGLWRYTTENPGGDWAAARELRVIMNHDDDAEVYLNGELAVKAPGHQTTGGQSIDVGLVELVPAK